MAAIHLYSIAVCPFAQRTRILLALKEADFELTEIDITKPRPDWFLALNPLGQVPVIAHRGHVLPESSIINEYLDEVLRGPRLLPEDPYHRAVARVVIEAVNSGFVPAMYRLLMNQDRARDEEITQAALAQWRRLDALLMQHNPAGTWLWEGFGMADLSAAPFFQRYCLNDWFRGFALPETAEYARVRRWRDAALAHPLVRRTGMPDEDYIKLYADYALGFGNGKTPPGRAHSSFDLAIPLAQRPMPPRGLRQAVTGSSG